MSSYLFIDDDIGLLRSNRIYFERRGHKVLTAKSYDEGVRLLEKYSVDCIILDILMPSVDGWEACKLLREQSSIPIIFLTSLSERECLYRGFAVGAADYMTKPYDFRELELRIMARISAGTAPEDVLLYPPLKIDAQGHRAEVNGSQVPLTAYEFDILLLLARNPGKVYSLEEIYRIIWHQPDLGNTLTVRSHLARMRHKLEDACPGTQYIDLVWGRGFFFKGNT